MADRLDRRQSFQSIAWFRDLYKRGLLELDPPYQRRSVWNQAYRDFFIETILLHYPAPAVFIYEEISAEGSATYSVVDGKQRLTTIFDFTDDLYPVAETAALERFQGKFFSQLDDDIRKQFWKYQFSVEFLPTTDEGTITNIFDRLNRNVARLTRQELRHARFDGAFASAADRLNEVLESEMPPAVPRIAATSRSQMKDVELVSQLMLLIENGPQSFAQDDLDFAYVNRDEAWEEEQEVEKQFRLVVAYLRELFEKGEGMQELRRLRNQADFYSLFGAVHQLLVAGAVPSPDDAVGRLAAFLVVVDDEEARVEDERADSYYLAARSASNDLKQRLTRIETLVEVLSE